MEIISPVVGQVRAKVGVVKGEQESKRTREQENKGERDTRGRKDRRHKK